MSTCFRGGGDPKCNSETLMCISRHGEAAAPWLSLWHTLSPLLEHCSALIRGLWWCRLWRLITPGLFGL